MFEFSYISVNDDIPAIPVATVIIGNPENPSISFTSDFGIIDTGSDITAISFTFISKLQLRPLPFKDLPSINIMGYQVSSIPYLINFSFGQNTKTLEKIFAVPDHVIKDEIIIGRNILNLYEIQLDARNGVFRISL